MTKDIIAESVQNDLRYLQLLARSFPTIADASTEIINLEAILNLPKRRPLRAEQWWMRLQVPST